MALPAIVVSGGGCGDPEPVSDARYAEPDRLFSIVEANVLASGALEKIVEIDHSRLGAEAGSVMPPARVLIFSNPGLDAELMARNPLVAIDLPLRALAYETVSGGDGRVTFNSFDYLRSRYGLDDLPELRAEYDASMAEALRGIEAEEISVFPTVAMQPDGITTIESPFDVETTVQRLSAAIDAQDDTVWFGKVDFQARAKEQGIDIAPAMMLLFGGPAPGAKAMAKAPTLGLDGFCQKLLVWQNETGAVNASFNDLLALAERQGVPKSPALRVINHRLVSTFESALESD
jgi:uncharacterized protein (DUF302 family)